MFGREELNRLDLEKQALIAASDLNRLVLQAESQNLRSATAWLRAPFQRSRTAAPLLLVLAPLAGFLLTRVSRGSGGWLKRLLAVAKWAGPVYQLWKGFSHGREDRSGEPDP